MHSLQVTINQYKNSRSTGSVLISLCSQMPWQQQQKEATFLPFGSDVNSLLANKSFCVFLRGQVELFCNAHQKRALLVLVSKEDISTQHRILIQEQNISCQAFLRL